MNLLDKLKDILPYELQQYRQDCCILATKIALDVLGYYRVPARPLTVRVFIANEPLAKRFEEGRPPKSQEELSKAMEEDNSYSIGLGYGHTEGKWSGHLVLVSEGWMLDLTLPQANRPQYGLVFSPLLVPTTEGFESGCESLVLTCGGGVVKYRAYPDDMSFQNSPDWKRLSPVVSRVIQKV